MDTNSLQRAAEKVAADCLSRITGAQPRVPAHSLDEEVATGRFSPSMEQFRALLATVTLHEGLLIQASFALPFVQDPGRLVETAPERVVVTDAEKMFLARNRDIDLDKIMPPAPGQPVGLAEIDVVVYDRGTRTLHLVDVKRSIGRGTSLDSLRLASLAYRRRTQDRLPVARTRLWALRWFADAPASSGPHIVTRATVDAAFGLPIRETVDHAVRLYRNGIAKCLQALLSETRPGNDRHVTGACPQPEPEPEAARPADVIAFREVFGRGASVGRGM